ncbi:hypothetical protein DPMN_038748 [Dreissena polymorpha]|uniref:Uncharacterized protein n=1 Tax=Dreissena polymorpha TaxID=45954 RepID=A0A9D4MDB9_DREPO|nr:hypothetical protein DPMN_038748 [Dreissena polymorpha]
MHLSNVAPIASLCLTYRENFAHLRGTNILGNFELSRDFIETKLLTKFHEDGTRNVASRVTYNGQRPITKAHLSNQFTSAFHRIFVRRPRADRGGSGGVSPPDRPRDSDFEIQAPQQGALK